MSVKFYGYRFSVYSWIARLAMVEKGVSYERVEIDPFASDVPADYLAVHPFKRVPALVHDGFTLYETEAITRYLDEAFSGPSLQPSDPRERARSNQVVSVVDSYVYWPFVRQVFSHGAFRPRLGRSFNTDEIRQGLAAAPRVLDALDQLASGATYLCCERLTLADIHLAPMIGYFTMVEEARSLVEQRPKLAKWWTRISAHPAFVATRPQLPHVQSAGANRGMTP